MANGEIKLSPPRRQRRRGRDQTAETVTHATERGGHDENSSLNSIKPEQSSTIRRRSMAERENQGFYEGFSRLSEACLSVEGAKKAAAWYIDTSEKIANQALDFQAKVTEWAKDTPIYPIIEAQQTIGRKFVEQSVSTARNLWRL